MSVIRVTIGVVPAALLAIPLYNYSIFDLGLPLVAFLIVLMGMGWSLGLAICGAILRHGMGAESMAWTVIFALAPLICAARWPSTWSTWPSAPRFSSSPSATPAAAARCCRWGNRRLIEPYSWTKIMGQKQALRPG